MNAGRKWLTTSSRLSAEKKKKKRTRAAENLGKDRERPNRQRDIPLYHHPCLRVAASDGHMAAVFVSFDKKPTMEEIKEKWASFKGVPQDLNLPSAPKQFLNYFEEDNRPQTKLDRNLGAEWLFPSADFVRTANTITNLSASPQHGQRCGRRRCFNGRTSGSTGLHGLVSAHTIIMTVKFQGRYDKSSYRSQTA